MSNNTAYTWLINNASQYGFVLAFPRYHNCVSPRLDLWTYIGEDSSLKSVELFSTPNSKGVIAIGVSEGNRNSDGSKNQSWYGHTDPGNDEHNVGTFSCQESTCTIRDPAGADLEFINTRLLPTMISFERTNPNLTVKELLTIADLLVQAPLTLETFLVKLEKAKSEGLTGDEAILQARVQSFYHPETGELDASGFGNSLDALKEDQARRQRAIFSVL